MPSTAASSIDAPTLESLGPTTLTALAGFYTNSNPEKDANAFVREFLMPMGADINTSGDAYLAKFKAIHKTDDEANLQYGPMLISCAYCIESMGLLSRGERELAWLRMAEARFWCGVTLANQGIVTARDLTIKATKKNTARKGGLAAADLRYKAIKDEAFRLARVCLPSANIWQSRLKAAKSIAGDVQKFSAARGTPLSSEQVQDTVYGWLADMPDAATLFRQRPKKGGA